VTPQRKTRLTPAATTPSSSTILLPIGRADRVKVGPFARRWRWVLGSGRSAAVTGRPPLGAVG
jgi:hypothetical protein